jgi:hypothetical protein
MKIPDIFFPLTKNEISSIGVDFSAKLSFWKDFGGTFTIAFSSSSELSQVKQQTKLGFG